MRFVVLTAVVTKMFVSWDIKPFIPMIVNALHDLLSEKLELFKNYY
jgi:hypothetical protein